MQDEHVNMYDLYVKLSLYFPGIQCLGDRTHLWLSNEGDCIVLLKSWY